MHQSKNRNDEGAGYERQTQAKRARRRWVVKTVAFISALQASTRALWNDPGPLRACPLLSYVAPLALPWRSGVGFWFVDALGGLKALALGDSS